MWYICTMECYSALGGEKERESCMLDKIDESGGNYAKWIKPVSKWQILHDPTCMRYLK